MSLIRSTLALLFPWCLFIPLPPPLLFPPSLVILTVLHAIKKTLHRRGKLLLHSGVGMKYFQRLGLWFWTRKYWLDRSLRSLRRMKRIEETSNSIKRDHSLHYQFRWDTSRQLRRQTLIRVRVRDIAFFPTDQVLSIARDQFSVSRSEAILHSSDRREGIKGGFPHR